MWLLSGRHFLKTAFILGIVSLQGCSLPRFGQDTAVTGQKYSGPDILFYTQRIAAQLFDRTPALPKGNLAVVSFTSVETLATQPNNDGLNRLGLQLQESMLTAAGQRGYHVTELRAGKGVLFYPDHEQYLIRNVNDVRQKVDVRYLITGTFNQSTNNTIINARLLDLHGNKVVAAVSSEIPNDAIGTESVQVQQRDNRLYRSSITR